MIKASDLRLGNWVKSDTYGEFQILGLIAMPNDEDAKSTAFKGFKYYPQSSNCEDLDPIELNEEWFLKLGFIVCQNEYDTTYEIGISDGYKLESAKSLTYTSFLLIEENNITGDNYFFLPHKIKYVHQLQNLYFALNEK